MKTNFWSKPLSLLLALALVLGMSINYFAAVNVNTAQSSEVTGFSGATIELGEVSLGYAYSYHLSSFENGQAFAVSFTDPSKASPNYGIYDKDGNLHRWDATDKDNLIAIRSSATAASKIEQYNLQYGSSGLVVASGVDVVSESDIPNPDGFGYSRQDLPEVAARLRISEGDNIIEKAELNFDGTGNTAQIYIKLVDSFVSGSGSQKFDFWVYPVVNGAAWAYEEYGIRLVGTLTGGTPNVSVSENPATTQSGGYFVTLGGGAPGGGGSSGGGASTSLVPRPLTQAQGLAAVRAAANGVATLRNPTNVPLAVLQAMGRAAPAGSQVNADSMSLVGNAVDVRLTFAIDDVIKALNLSASTQNSQAVNAKATFSKYYTNQFSTVNLSQTGAFGMSVKIAARLNPDITDTSDLVFYLYDAAANKFSRIVTNYRVDANGYVHFNTTQGGTVVISDGQLSK
jgi:hypothetical protein